MMATSLIIQSRFLIVFSFVLLFLFVMLLLYHNSSCLSTPIAQDYTSNRNNPVRYWSSVHMFYLIAGWWYDRRCRSYGTLLSNRHRMWNRLN
jgi:hypothetical protein